MPLTECCGVKMSRELYWRNGYVRICNLCLKAVVACETCDRQVNFICSNCNPLE